MSSPLAHAAHVAALAALARSPDPRSALAESRDPSATIRVYPPEKEAFDALQRAVSTLLARRATQAETARWLLAFALDHQDAFLAAVRATRGP